MFVFFIVLALCTLTSSFQKDNPWRVNDEQELINKQFWLEDAQRTLRNKLNQFENRNKAKNVIFFIGDGMSVPTVTASRIYEGQMKGILGERNQLFFEKFPYVGLSKTYCVNKQVSDSACTGTAYHSGIKANYETIGVSPNVELSDCNGANQTENQLESISGWAQRAGKATGIVTTTRITHASPAGAYAHTSHRNYESDNDVVSMGSDPKRCNDIGQQLVDNQISRNFNIVMGGGARKLLPNGTIDNAAGFVGERLDNRNLISEWLDGKSSSSKYVNTREQLKDLNVNDTDNLIGIFANDHLSYNLDNDGSQPSLEEMTDSAIRILQKEQNGFYLFVEGGRIDHAHHETKAVKALDETIQFAAAIQRAYELTDPNETLIVVSADHGHTMTINGYPKIGTSITGVGTDLSDIDNLPYMTLSYANGPAFNDFLNPYNTQYVNGLQKMLFGLKKEDIKRVDLRKISNIGSKDFQYPATVPLADETHGGGDVAIYASGPWSHLFTGVVEQNVLPVMMGFASCIGPGLHSCGL